MTRCVIPLTRGKEALVSRVDYAFLMQWKWTYYAAGYAGRVKRNNKVVYMHHVIASRKGIVFEEIDHRNQVKLDNRRSNLRSATSAQNKANRPKYHTNTSGYKGVFWHQKAGKWMAQIGYRGRVKYLGLFRYRTQAAREYNKWASKLFGKFAQLNCV